MAVVMNGGMVHQFRVIVIGDTGVGKSSLVRSFINSSFKEKSQPTIGVNFYAAVIGLNDDLHVKLQIWDTAGQEKYRSIIHSYYRNCAGCFVVYNIADRDSFYHVDSWLDEARDSIDNENIVYFLVGHKIDLNDIREVETSEGEKYAQAHDMMFLETSSKLLCNIERLFFTMAEEICKERVPQKFITKGLSDRKAVLLSSHEDLLSNGDLNGQKQRICCST